MDRLRSGGRVAAEPYDSIKPKPSYGDLCSGLHSSSMIIYAVLM